METINNVAANVTAAASNLIWGEQNKTDEAATAGTEPVSGQKGDVKAGEPYDAGNIENTTASANTGSTTSATTAPTTSSLESTTETTKTGSTLSPQPPTTISSTEYSSSTTTHASNPLSTTQVPSETHKSTDAFATTKDDAIRDPLRDAGEPAKVKLDGPGPKPLTDRSDALPAVAGRSSHEDPKKENTGEGTGQIYVQSSGAKADAGDFNTSNTGAGKEADRILGSHGVAREEPATSSAGVDKSTHESEQDHGHGRKLSLKEKIKAKLHKS